MKVTKNSIWDQLYCFPSQYKSSTTNICEYTRGVLRGIFVALCFVLGGVLTGLFVLYPYFILGMAFITGYYEPELAGHSDKAFFIMSLVVQGIIGLIVLIAVIHDYTIPYRERRQFKISRSPSFLRLWYRSIKEKTCFIIERE